MNSTSAGQLSSTFIPALLLLKLQLFHPSSALFSRLSRRLFFAEGLLMFLFLSHLSPAWCYLFHPTFLWSLKCNFDILQKLSMSKCWPYVELGVGGLYRMFQHNLSQLKTNTNHMHFPPTDYVYICDLHFFPLLIFYCLHS